VKLVNSQVKCISIWIMVFSCLFPNYFWFSCIIYMMSSISWAWFSSILQSKQLQVIVHPWTLSLHRFISSTVFQRISVDIWTWPCSYWLHCGLHT